MENVFKYYEFSSFIQDTSNTFSGNEICFSELNPEHFLIFEKAENQFNLYISKFLGKHEIGKKAPQIIETLVVNYNKNNPEHRVALRRYFE